MKYAGVHMHEAGIASVEKIQSALSYLSPDDRELWIKMGMAVKAELGDAGQWIWEDWASTADSYNAASSKAVWKSFKHGGKVNIGTLFYLAKEQGWTWNKPEKKLSPAEVERIRTESRRKADAAAAEKAKQQEIASVEALAIWDAAQPATEHPYLTKKKVKSHGLRVGEWWKRDTNGVQRLITKLALLVPIKDRTGKLWSLQAIFPRKMLADRDKDYFPGGAKSGHFHAIGKPQEINGCKVFVICEGYATGATIHELTGHLVLVTFDRSNLLPVAAAIRERQPDAIILFAADNDQFAKPKKDGSQHNPGVEDATKAAAEVGGLVAIPQFSSLEGEPTDFNDLCDREGGEAVIKQINAALASQAVEPDPEPEEAATVSERPQSFADIANELAPPDGIEDTNSPEIPPSEINESEHLNKNKFFTVLGYDHEEYFIFVHAKQQVLTRKRSDFSKSGLLELANDLNWWEMNFPQGGKTPGVDTDAAFQWIIAMAHVRGVYDPTNVRGRGAWLDDGRVVYHLGDILLVDGKETAIDEISSAYVYPRGRKLQRPNKKPMTMDEGRKLLNVSRMVRWNMEGSAVLLAGWAFLAPICGALKWRPHIWVTGAAGSGKSTVQRDFCYALTRGISKYGQGDSTEPGIRQALRSDAVPVLIDEIESNDEYEKKRTDAVLAMMRKASTESDAETMKGTASGEGSAFHIRSMFCLASINTKLDKPADIDRVTKLVIRVPPKDGSQIAHWQELESRLREISEDESIPSRLMARGLSMVPSVLASVRVFIRVASKKFNSQRMGDQYGTLIAGCWCLCNDHVATEAEALKMIEAYDWNEHIEDQDQDDAADALRSIMSAKIRMGGVVGELAVFELVREAHSVHRDGDIGVDRNVADATLKRHGIRMDEEGNALIFGTSVPNLKALLKNTAYSTDARGQLLRLPGAVRMDKTLRFNGSASKCVSVPLSLVFDEGDPKLMQAPSAMAQDNWPGKDEFPL